MYFKVKCPHCQKSLRVREESSGKKCACPHCRGSFRIPQIAAGSSLSLPNTGGTPDLNLGAGPGLDLGASQPAPGLNLSQTPAQPSAPREKKPAPSPGPEVSSPAAPAASAASSPSTMPSTSGKWTDSSNVSLITSGLIGAVVSAVFLSAVWPLRGFQFGQLFWDRGGVPFVLTLLMFWSFAILFLKWQKITRQKASMLLDVLPTEVADAITVESIDKFGTHISSLPGEPGESFLLNRVIRGLEHFRVRQNAAETVTMMSSQSDIDANNVASSYTLLKVFIWALPILGFIGTVIGVSAAVASLGGSLENTSDISAVKGALNDVFAGLGTAFDTTLLALIMSMMVKIPASALQKSEDDLVTQVDEYCNENLLRRLNDGGAAERAAVNNLNNLKGIDGSVFRQAVEEGMATHQVELEKWLKKLDAIGSKLTAQVSDGWNEINGKIQQQQHEFAAQTMQQQQAVTQHLQHSLEQMNENAGHIQQTLAGLAEQTAAVQTHVVAEAAKGWDELAARIHQQQVEIATQGLQQQQVAAQQLQQQMQQMNESAAQIQQTLAGLGEQTATMQSEVASTVNGSSQTLQTHFAGLERGLTSLSTVLERLGDQQVVVQQVEPKKRGWFSKRNGRR